MNAPARKVFEGEILAPGQGLVTVIGETHPFHGGRVTYTAPAGATIAELVELGFPERGGRPFTAYLVDERGELVIPQEHWHRVRPKPGVTLALKVRLAGGALRSVALIAVAVAALVLAPILAPVALGALGIGVTATSVAVASGLIAAGITIAGSLAVNQLFPVRPQNLASQIQSGAAGGDLLRKTVYSIQGARNQARPYSPFPAVFGRRRVWPPLLSKVFTELVGDDEYLRLYLLVGYGPLQISDLRIGETPISAFNDVQVEIREGYEDDDPITLYPARDPQQEVLSIKLVGTETAVRQTALETDEISVDITAPSGIYQWNSTNGSPQAYGVTVNTYYRAVGAVDWIHFGQVNFQLETSTARRGTRVAVARGQYEVWVHKAQSDQFNTNIHEDVYWTALRSFKAEEPLVTPSPMARIAMRIRATGQTNGIIDQINCIAESVQLCFNGSSWELGVSSNPADLYRLGLQHPANKRAAADVDLPLENLEAFWQYCDDKGFAFNFVYEDKTSVSEMLADIAAAGRGASVFVDSKRGVAWDDPTNENVVQHITPRNSSGFQAQRNYRHFPHAWRIPFVNELKGYSADERVVYADGFDETNATLFESREFPGITDPDLIWKHARYQDAQDRLRPERYSVIMRWDQLRCTFNDLVRLTHHVPLLGQISARVKAVVGQVVTLDETVTMEADAVYAVRFRLASGDTLLRDVVFAVGESSTIELDGAGDVPAVGDLAMFGEAGEESIACRVFSIAHRDKLEARITLVDAAPEIADADFGIIPDFDSHISDPVDFYSLPPQDLRVSEIIDGSGGAKTPVVRLSWRVPRQGRVVSFEAEALDQTAGSDYTLRRTVQWPQTYAEFREILLGTWAFRVRAIFADGNFSNWATLSAEQITGTHLSSALPNVTDLHGVYRFNVLSLDWQEIEDFRPVAYEIRKGDDFESSLFLQTVAHPPFPTMGIGTYWVQAISTPVVGLTVYSAAPTEILIDGAVLTQNVVAQFDHADLGWPGIFGGTAAISGAIIRTGGAGNILSVSDFLAESDIINFGGGGDGTYETPEAHTFDMGRVVDVGIAIDLNAAGSRVDDNILDDPDILANPDILDTAASRFVDVYAEISVAINDDPHNWEWSPWERWSSGRKTARAVKARLVLLSNDPNVFAFVTTFVVTIDMPDRVDRYAYETQAGGDTIVFTPDLAVDPAPFNGGPNGSPFPFMSGVIEAPQNGDRLRFTALDESSVTVQVVDAAGTGQVRDVLILAQGF